MNKTKGMPLNSPMEGNKFTLELKNAKDRGLTGDAAYQAAQDAVSTMKIQYGTGSPTQLKKYK